MAHCFFEGVPALCTDNWLKRRQELKRMFLREMYGERPVERPANISFEVRPDRPCLGGSAVHRQVRISAEGPRGEFSFRANAYLPRGVKDLPSFVYVYLGSTARKQHFDPFAECPDTIAFPVSEIVKRGYAVVQFDNWEVAMDDPKACFETGVFAAWGPSADERTDRSWGAISAWAWGASRVLDWIETQPEFDLQRVSVIGHSRGGKTALLAGVTDERFRLACVNDSGCGGAKVGHLDLPLSESIEQINARFPHWFCRNYHRYGGKDRTMPFDQHQMVALMAPRAVAIASSSEDAWAGPAGEFACARLASPAWGVYGLPGLVSSDAMPKLDAHLADGTVSYHIKPGPHSITACDWNRYMDFETRVHAHGRVQLKAMLLHLGNNMWSTSDAELRLKDGYWRRATGEMVEKGISTLIVDIGEGLVFPSHPELAIRGSWTAEKMMSELSRLRKAGLEVLPKLNFSATHDAWLGPYARMVSTPEYYKVVADVISDVAEVFGRPRLFHLGWDEETAGHQGGYDYVVVRNGDLWWHDFLFTVRCCEENGCRPWVWSDYGWHHPDYLTRCPKRVMQSNWYYDEECEGFDLANTGMKVSRPYLELYLKLDKAGFDQIPCGTNWISGTRREKGIGADEVMGSLVRFARANIAPDRMKGFLMTSWKPLDSEQNLKTNLSAIDIFAEAVK